MEAIYKNKPIYRQAYILSERCKDLGIKLVYNQRNKMVYISLLNAPSMVEGIEEAEQTVVLCLSNFSDVRDHIEHIANVYKDRYRSYYKGNNEMLKYIE